MTMDNSQVMTLLVSLVMFVFPKVAAVFPLAKEHFQKDSRLIPADSSVHANLDIVQDIPISRVHITKDAGVLMHIDWRDLGGTVIMWTHGSSELLDMGGGFLVNDYRIRVSLTGRTFLFLRSDKLWHGSIKPVTSHGGALSRIGIAFCNNAHAVTVARSQLLPFSSDSKVSGTGCTWRPEE